jgi:hypothetical protein
MIYRLSELWRLSKVLTQGVYCRVALEYLTSAMTQVMQSKMNVCAIIMKVLQPGECSV